MKKSYQEVIDELFFAFILNDMLSRKQEKSVTGRASFRDLSLLYL